MKKINKHRGFAPLIFLLVLALIAVGGWWFAHPERQLPANVCTQDAKICPDGSAVGRIPPRCDFAACPVSTVAPSSSDTTNSFRDISDIDLNINNWKTYRNTQYNFEFKYPPILALVFDKEGAPYSTGVKPYSISLNDVKAGGQISLNININGDGWGPQYPDITFNLATTTIGNVIVSSEVTDLSNEVGEFADKKWFTAHMGKWGESYEWTYIADNNSPYHEKIFRAIISTFKFTK